MSQLENKVLKTLEEWEESGLSLSDYLTPCDEIDEDLYQYAEDSTQPEYLSNDLLQTGEAMFERHGLFFYDSFRVVGERYFYLGALPEFNKSPDYHNQQPPHNQPKCVN